MRSPGIGFSTCAGSIDARLCPITRPSRQAADSSSANGASSTMASGSRGSPCQGGSSSSMSSRGPRRVFQRTADSDGMLAASITASASASPSDLRRPLAIQSGNEWRRAASPSPNDAMDAGPVSAMRRRTAFTSPARAPPRPRGPGSERARVAA